MQCLAPTVAFLIFALGMGAAGRAQEALRSSEQLLTIRQDLWAEAAIRQPGGPNYEYFAGLLPPLRYVNTAFRHYPIVLSAPLAEVKARWISNGSGVNLRADKPPMWKEVGTPVAFFVGDKPVPFGDDSMLETLTGPHFADDWLPVVQVRCVSDGVVYSQEAFAPVREELARNGAVFVRFGGRLLARPVVVRIGAKVTVRDRAILDDKGNAVVCFGPRWEWNADKSELSAKVGNGAAVELLVFT